MRSGFWTYLFEHWKAIYFAAPFVILCQVTALFAYIKYWKKEKIYSLFLLYIISGLILFILSPIILYHFKGDLRRRTILTESLNISFAFVEFSVFCYFLRSILKSVFVLHVIKFCSALFLIGILFFIFKMTNPQSSNAEIRIITDRVIFTELTTIGLLTLIYFFELFRPSSYTDLVKSPSFWIIVFSLLYTLVIPPILFLSEIIKIEDFDTLRLFFSLHYFSFGLVFIGITKALLCKRPLTS